MSLKSIRKQIERLEKESRLSGGMITLNITPDNGTYSVEYYKDSVKRTDEGFSSRTEAWKRCDEILEEFRPEYSIIFLNEFEEYMDEELDHYLQTRENNGNKHVIFLDNVPLED